jgi:hypothetical protein
MTWRTMSSRPWDGGGISVGMTWYVEIEGEPFPNARGASLYRISPDSGKLIYARDVAGGSLRTSTRPILCFDKLSRCVYMSVHPERAR